MDLVVAVSCSGETEETLAVADEALRRGCPARHRRRAPARRWPSARPAGARPAPAGRRRGRLPRANLWALAVPLLLVADALGPGDACRATLAARRRPARRDQPSAAGRAPTASSTRRKRSRSSWPAAAVSCGAASELAAVAAYRFACQLAENAKTRRSRRAARGQPQPGRRRSPAAFGARGGARRRHLPRPRRGRAGRPAAAAAGAAARHRRAPGGRRAAPTRRASSPTDGVPLRRAARRRASTRWSGWPAWSRRWTSPASTSRCCQGIDPTPIEPITELKARQHAER